MTKSVEGGGICLEKFSPKNVFFLRFPHYKYYERLKIIFLRPFPTFNSMPSFQDLIGIALLALARAIISISIEMPSGAG